MFRNYDKADALKRIERFKKHIDADPVFRTRYRIGSLEIQLKPVERDMATARKRAEENSKRHRDDREYGICDSFAMGDSIKSDIRRLENMIVEYVNTYKCPEMLVKIKDLDLFRNEVTNADQYLEFYPQLTDKGVWCNFREDGWYLEDGGASLSLEQLTNFKMISILETVRDFE